MGFNTKRELLKSVVEAIYDVHCISFTESGLDRYSYHVNKVKFNKKGEERFKKVFRYTFIEKKPVYDNPQRQKKEEPIPRIPTFKSALKWLSDFFNMGIVPESLIKRQDEELDAWGKKLYDCYMDLIDVLFLDRGSGEDEEINCEEIKAFLSDSIKERLLGKKDDASQIHTQVASTPCIPQAYKVDSKPSPREIAAILGTKTSLDSLVAKVPKRRFGELPHKEELPQEADYTYNYEDFIKNIDDANAALSRLPKELNELQLLFLKHNIEIIRNTENGLQEAGRFIFKLYPMSDSPYDNDRYFDDEEYPAPFQYKVEAFAGNDLVYIGDIGYKNSAQVFLGEIGYKYPAQVFLGETGKIYTYIFGSIQCYDSLLDVLLYRCSSICDTNSEKFKTVVDLLLSNFKAADNWEYVTMRRY